MHNALPHINFSIQHAYLGETIQYVRQRSLITSQSGGHVTVSIGYFDVPDSGSYIITSLPESQFIENEEIVIRKHLPVAKFVLLILGIVFGAMLFLCGIIFGALFVAEVLTMPATANLISGPVMDLIS